MARLAKAAKAASWVSVGLAGLFVLFHETPLLAVVGLAVGFLGLLVQSAGGETRTTVPVLGLFLNGFGVAGMYAQRYAVKYVASLRGGQFLTAQDLKSIPMAAFLGPLVAGGLVVLLTKSNLPSAQTPDSVMPAAKVEPLDVVLGVAKGRRVVLKHEDRYLHTLVVGTTGTGKTSQAVDIDMKPAKAKKTDDFFG